MAKGWFSAPQDESMMGWARSCFREFFINLLDDPVVRAPAVTAGAEMRRRLDALLAERRAADLEGADDVMGRSSSRPATSPARCRRNRRHMANLG
jgi:hypothetical protein